MTTLSTIKDEARERFKSRVADILENIDPSQVHISEDSRIYFKDETCGAMFSEIDRAVEVVTEEQNRVVNSGRKLFQEGMKVGVRAVVEELQKMFVPGSQAERNDMIDDLLQKLSTLNEK